VGIPIEIVQFLLKLLLKQISCYAPPFPLTKLLTAKLHSVYVKKSEILERSDILGPTPQPSCSPVLATAFVNIFCFDCSRPFKF